MVTDAASRARSFFEPLTPEKRTLQLCSCHSHSSYSALDGMSKIKDYLKRVKELTPAGKTPAAALTDHGTMAGIVSFFAAGEEIGVKTLAGFEAYVAPGSRLERTAEKTFHLTLIAADWQGYQNLTRLTSLSYAPEAFYRKPRIDKELLKECSAGVIATTGCIGAEIPQLLLAGKTAEAERLFLWYLGVFGKRFFVEIQNHGIAEQQTLNPQLKTLALKYGVPLIATQDDHYTRKSDAQAHEALLAIQTKAVLSDASRFKFPSEEFYLKSAEELQEFLPVDEWGEEIYDNTVTLAGMCTLELPIGKRRVYHFPELPSATGASPAETLRLKSYEGLGFRYPQEDFDWGGYLKSCFELAKSLPEGTKASLRKRLTKTTLSDLSVVVTALETAGIPLPATGEKLTRVEYELSVINSMGFPDYMLIVADYITWAKENGVTSGPGRGSSTGSLVCYCTRITELDPLQYGLIFERFLNPDRKSMPDIDTDFSDTGREKVIRYVRERYGADRVAYISTFGTLGTRVVLKDVARVMEYPYAEIDILTKLIPSKFGKNSTLEECESIPEIAGMLRASSGLRRVYSTAKKLEGLNRHASVHASGVVIAASPLTDLVPTLVDRKSGDTVVQYDMKSVEDIGLVKMDFLGLRTLTLLEKTLELVHAKTPEFTLEGLDRTDGKTFALLQTGNLKGVFQLEGAGISAAAKSLRPDRFEDIIALSALYRPGPMANIPSYIARKHGKEKIEFRDYPQAGKVLEPILRETYGIIVYQEQVMELARTLCGYTGAQADNFRRGIGKKDRAVVEAEKPGFVQGGVQTHGIPEAEMEKLFTTVAAFADYSFNKSHSAAYGTISFQTAYLKAHFPLEFAAALLTVEAGDSDKLAEYLADTRRSGIPVLPPDVNLSGRSFVPAKKGVVFGLGGVKNLGEHAIERILEERVKDEFLSFFDFVSRLGKEINAKGITALVLAGALDGFGERKTLLDNTELALRYAKGIASTAASGMDSLFALTEVLPEPALKPSTPFTELERFQAEKTALGFYVSGHPLETRPGLALSATHNLAELEPGDGRVVLACVLESIDKKPTRKGDLYAKLLVSDASGTAEVVVFPKTLERVTQALVLNTPLLLVLSYGDESLSLESVPDLEKTGKCVRVSAEALAREGVKETLASAIEDFGMPLLTRLLHGDEWEELELGKVPVEFFAALKKEIPELEVCYDSREILDAKKPNWR